MPALETWRLHHTLLVCHRPPAPFQVLCHCHGVKATFMCTPRPTPHHDQPSGDATGLLGAKEGGRDKAYVTEERGDQARPVEVWAKSCTSALTNNTQEYQKDTHKKKHQMLRNYLLFSYSHHGLALLHPNTTLVSKQQNPPTPPPVTVQPSQHRTAQHPTHHQLLLYLDHHPKNTAPAALPQQVS